MHSVFQSLSLLILLSIVPVHAQRRSLKGGPFDFFKDVWNFVTDQGGGGSDEQLAYVSDEYTLVANSSQLWRFQVGADWIEGFTLGTSHICLLSSHSKFVRVRDGKSIKNDYYNCKKDERLKVVFKNGYMFLQPFDDGGYIACAEDGGMRVVRERCMDARFEAYLKGDNQLVLFSPTHERYVTAKESGGVHCGKLHYLEDEHFRGWKRGNKEVWTPRDRWDYVIGLSQKNTSANGHIEIKKEVGVERSKTESKILSVTGSVSTQGLSTFFLGQIDISKEWVKTTTKTWYSLKTYTVSTNVRNGTHAEIYQLIGLCGPFTIHSSEFETREVD